MKNECSENRHGGGGARHGAAAAGPKLHVISLKRANNVAIFLAKTTRGLTVQQLSRAAQQFDSRLLLGTVVRVGRCPTPSARPEPRTLHHEP